jgi:predicted HD phosphohydrolase
VDRLTHSLQTASRAWRDGRDEEYVVCALLHDIGDTLAPTTTRTSPRRSSSRSSARELVDGGETRIFQGYYFFHHLGMDRHLREQFSDTRSTSNHRILCQVRCGGV